MSLQWDVKRLCSKVEKVGKDQNGDVNRRRRREEIREREREEKSQVLYRDM